MFGVQHSLVDTVSSAKWQQPGDLGGATDRTSSVYPATRAYDLYGHAQTAPSTGATVYYFVTQVTGAYAVDYVGIVGHNFGTIGATSVSFILSTDNLFDTGANSYTVKTWSSPGNTRLGSCALYHTGTTPLHYYGHTYAAVKVTCGSSQIPAIGELWFGNRLSNQIPYAPNINWDPTGPYVNNYSTITTQGGVISRYRKAYNVRKCEATWSLANTTANKAIVYAIYDGTTAFSRPFLFWENCNSNPNGFNVMYEEEGGLDWKLVGPSERVFTMRMIETAPFLRNG
jgi:hypothetical protein